MSWFKSLRIEVKFVGAFMIVASIAAVVGFLGIRNMSIIDGLAGRMYHNELMGLSYIKQADIDLGYLVRAQKNLILSSSVEDRRKSMEQLKTREVEYLENLKKSKPLFITKKGKELFAQVEKAWEEYHPVHKQLIDIAMKEDLIEKKASTELSMGVARQKIHALDDALMKLTRQKEAKAKDASEEAAAIYASSRTLMIILSIAGFLAGIVLGVIMTLSITRPIKRIIEGLWEGAEQVASATGQVSSASQQLAEGSSQQAASIEEVSSSMEEMSSMTKQNTGNANQANKLMRQTMDTVSQASLTMARLTGSMAEISKSSEETSKIVKTIDEIAFQTNLLALNAAVEAARAGEAGAGFAVVADEVRNLAMRAAEAAKNTASLIEGTVKRVKEGSELVTKTDEEFRKVATDVSRSGELVGEITAATGEQAQGIEQINRAVSEMDKVVQQNAANAEESASASEEMNVQAEQMKGYVADLLSLVGGTDGSADIGNTAAPGRTSEKKITRIPVHVRKGNGRIHNGNGMNLRGSGKGEMRPEHLIPFDEQELPDF